MILYDFINRFLFYKKGKLIRFIFELIFFLSMALIFFVILLKISNANLNVFIPIFIFLGVLSYIFLMQYFFIYLYNKIFMYFSDKLKEKKILIQNKFAIIKERIKKRKIAKHEKNQKSKRNNSKQK